MALCLLATKRLSLHLVLALWSRVLWNQGQLAGIAGFQQLLFAPKTAAKSEKDNAHYKLPMLQDGQFYAFRDANADGVIFGDNEVGSRMSPCCVGSC